MRSQTSSIRTPVGLGVRQRAALRSVLILNAVIIVVALIAGTIVGDSLARTMTDGIVIISAVVALQVFVGNSGIVSFGHVAFYGMGAYTAAFVTTGASKLDDLAAVPALLRDQTLTFWPALVVSTIVTVVIVAVVAWPLSRMSELAMAMATLAILVLFHTVFANWEGLTRANRGINSIPRLTNLTLATVVAVIVVAIALIYRASAFGLRVQAAREDPVAAEMMGINTTRERYRCLVLSGGLTAAAGAVWGMNSLAFGPDAFFFSETFARLSMLVVGGMYSVTGAIVGVAVVMVVQEIARNFDSVGGVVQLSVALLMLLVLLFRPTGLAGTDEVGWRRTSPNDQRDTDDERDNTDEHDKDDERDDADGHEAATVAPIAGDDA